MFCKSYTGIWDWEKNKSKHLMAIVILCFYCMKNGISRSRWNKAIKLTLDSDFETMLRVFSLSLSFSRLANSSLSFRSDSRNCSSWSISSSDSEVESDFDGPAFWLWRQKRMTCYINLKMLLQCVQKSLKDVCKGLFHVDTLKSYFPVLIVSSKTGAKK